MGNSYNGKNGADSLLQNVVNNLGEAAGELVEKIETCCTATPAIKMDIAKDQPAKEKYVDKNLKLINQKTPPSNQSEKTEVPKDLEIVALYYVAHNSEFVALTQAESDALRIEEDMINAIMAPLVQALSKDSATEENVDEEKKEVHKKLQDYGINPAAGDLTEIRRVSGNKFTYVRSDKIKNHIRKYSMTADDKKRSELRTNGKLSLDKLKKALTKKTTTNVVWKLKDFEKTAFGKWANTFSDEAIADYYSDEEKQTEAYKRRMFDASAGAQWMRFAGGAGVQANFSDITKGKLSANLKVDGRFALGQAQAKVVGHIPHAQGFHAKLPNFATEKDLDFGYFKLEMECILQGFAGASACIDIGVNFDVTGDNLVISTQEDKKKSAKKQEVGKARGEVFAGVSASADVSAKALWKNPQKNKDFTAIASVGYGIKGALGLGAEGEFLVSFEQGKFILRAKAGVVFGGGASGNVGFMIDAKTIVNMVQFIYHLLMNADYRKLSCISDKAFYALSSYLVQSIIDSLELIEDSWIELTELWEDDIAAMKQAKALAKSINQGEQDELLRVSTPEAKGKMLAMLCETDFLDAEEEQEKAIIKLLNHVQSKSEGRNVFKSITLNGSRLSDAKQGEEKLHNILDWLYYDGEAAFDQWWDPLPETPPNIGQKVVALNTLSDQGIMPLEERGKLA